MFLQRYFTPSPIRRREKRRWSVIASWTRRKFSLMPFCSSFCDVSFLNYLDLIFRSVLRDDGADGEYHVDVDLCDDSDFNYNAEYSDDNDEVSNVVVIILLILLHILSVAV